MPHPIQNPDNLLRLGVNLERDDRKFALLHCKQRGWGLGSSTGVRVINVAAAVAADDVAAG